MAPGKVRHRGRRAINWGLGPHHEQLMGIDGDDGEHRWSRSASKRHSMWRSSTCRIPADGGAICRLPRAGVPYTEEVSTEARDAIRMLLPSRTGIEQFVGAAGYTHDVLPSPKSDWSRCNNLLGLHNPCYVVHTLRLDITLTSKGYDKLAT